MHLPPWLLASIGLVGVVAGRLLFDRWFNHLSLYSLIWGTGLALFELRLIDYTPLTAEIWMLMGYAWIAFTVGSAILILARLAVGDRPSMSVTPYSARATLLEKRFLFAAIVILSIVAMLAVVQHWSVLIKKFGSIAGVLVSGNLIYRLTVAGKLPGQIPYFDCFGLAAACLAGIYSARAGKIKLLTLLPLAIIILADIGQGGRAKIVIAGILFLSAYFLARLTPARVKTFQAISNGRQLLTLGLVLVILFAAAEFVRSYRGAFEGFYGTSKELSKFERSVFITPSMYLYLSSHPGVFSAYWKAGGEHPFPGSYTFAPLFRILSRFGIADYIPHFQKHYNIPITTNTGTYLRELHADFGIAGILVIPYLLGFFCTILWLKIRRQPRLVSIALLTHIYVIVAFSYFYQVTRLGQWAVSLIASLIVSYFIDRRCYAGGARQDLAPLE